MGVRVLCYFEYTGYSPRGITSRSTSSVMIDVEPVNGALLEADIVREFEYAMKTRAREHTVFRPGMRPVEWTLLKYLTQNNAKAI